MSAAEQLQYRDLTWTASEWTGDPVLRVAEVVRMAAERAEAAKAPTWRRADQRYLLEQSLQISRFAPVDGKLVHAFEAWGVDLSYQGAGMLATEPVSLGEELYLSLERLGEDLVLPVRVAFVRPLLAGLYQFGVTLQFRREEGEVTFG